MSCPNFEPMKYGMPMVCGGLYLEEDEDGYWEFEDASYLAKKFTKELKYHDVNVQSGYYYGFQFVVDEKLSSQFDLDKDSEYCIDNEDAHYYYNMCRSQVIRKADAEKRKIRKWLEKIAEDYGYEILVRTALFSNGEAVYERRTPRALIKSLCA